MGREKPSDGAQAMPVRTVTAAAGRVALTTAGAAVGSGGAMPAATFAFAAEAEVTGAAGTSSQPHSARARMNRETGRREVREKKLGFAPEGRESRPSRLPVFLFNLSLRFEAENLDLTGFHVGTPEA